MHCDAQGARRLSFGASRKLLVLVAIALFVSSCTYLGAVAKQSQRARRQSVEPSLNNLKHLLDTETCYVYGRVSDPEGQLQGRHVAVAAYADAYGKSELVDIMQHARVGTHYALNLPLAPDQSYRILVLSDTNGNGFLDPSEVWGERELTPEQLSAANRVLRNVDISLSRETKATIPRALPAETPVELQSSVVYPAGTIRSLADPLFDAELATLGVYEPAAFSERASTMFYALEEDVGYKIPVVFVHGMGGSARQFEALVERLDRRRFKPWFFHYPSGMPIGQLAKLFHGVYLSGDAVNRHLKIPMVVVAHSMGGLVVREALNLLDTEKEKAQGPIHFLSLASPLGGHPAAAAGESQGLLVVPSWRSLNPAGEFIAKLYRKPLPPSVTHHLLHAFGNDDLIRFGANSDGTVPLSSQLRQEAQAEATQVRGFNASHAGILTDADSVDYVITEIHRQRVDVPNDHMSWYLRGGFEVPPDCNLPPILTHLIATQGQHLRALARGDIAPLEPVERDWVEVAQGRAQPSEPMARALLQCLQRYPKLTPRRP